MHELEMSLNNANKSNVSSMITNNNNVTMVKTELEDKLKSVMDFESLMREEHQRLVQIDGAKKALENEVITKSIYGVIHLVEYKLLFQLK